MIDDDRDPYWPSQEAQRISMAAGARGILARLGPAPTQSKDTAYREHLMKRQCTCPVCVRFSDLCKTSSCEEAIQEILRGLK
jgi:hypothetical protein